MVDEAGDTGIGAAGHVTAQLYGAKARIAEVLPVARRVAPPSVVGDDREQLSSVVNIFFTKFRLD